MLWCFVHTPPISNVRDFQQNSIYRVTSLETQDGCNPTGTLDIAIFRDSTTLAGGTLQRRPVAPKIVAEKTNSTPAPHLVGAFIWRGPGMCLNIFWSVFLLFRYVFKGKKLNQRQFHLPLGYFLGVPSWSICTSSCYSTKRKRWKQNELFWKKCLPAHMMIVSVRLFDRQLSLQLGGNLQESQLDDKFRHPH